MKTNNIFKSFAVLAAVLAFSAVACDEPAPVEPVTPIFPELIENYAVVPGETLSITFTPNMDWEVSVPEDTMDFFWLSDGGFSDSKISGKGGDVPVTVNVQVSDKEDFVNRTTTVKLTMGGETRIIAKYMRPALGKSLQMYVCQVDEEGAFVFDDNGGYAFGEEEAENVALTWTGSDFRIRVKVVSNFDWVMSLPEWAKADIPDVKVGTQEFNIYGEPSKYPLENTSDKVSFKFGTEVVAETAISIPGCKDIFSYGVDVVTALNFNERGRYVSPISIVDGPATAWFEGTEKASVYAVELKDGKYDLTAGSDPDWLKIVISDYDHTSGADVLQRRSVEISVAEYDGNEHSAVLLFLPPADRKDLKNYFNDDVTALKDEWAANAVEVTYKEYGYIMVADQTALTDAGASIETLSQGTLNKNAEYAYCLKYDNQYASDGARLLMLEPYGSFRIYDAMGLEVKNTEGFFLNFVEDESKEAGVITMTGELASEGYVVFMGSDAKTVLAEVKCVYAPETTVEDTRTEDLIVDGSRFLTDADAAAAAGASLVEILAGPTHRECEDARNDGAVLLRLTAPYNTPVTINVPSNAYMIAGYPKDSFDIAKLDLSAGAAFLGSKKTIDISFGEFPAGYAPDPENPDADYITPSVRMYNKDNKAVLVIYCETVK